MCTETIAPRASAPTKKFFDFRTPTEHISFIIGVCMLVVSALPLAICLASATLWEAADRGFAGGFTQSGKELTGLVCGKLVPWLTKTTQKHNEQYIRRPEDAFLLNCLIAYGIGIPLLCAYTAYVVNTSSSYQWSLLTMYLYNVFRTGPFFMNFAYVYTLSHKEAHTHVGLLAKKYHNSYTSVVWNWWIGLFYGVTPGAFHYGHVVNHHRYNNEYLDAHTTGDKPRDSFVNFVAYLPRWFLYASNLSTMYVIGVHDKNWAQVAKMVRSTLYYIAWIAVCWVVAGPLFTIGCILYPFMESLVLLAAINWFWHGFMDPKDPLNEYVISPTLIDGPVNVLNEDMHVVHHQYPGQAWITHPTHVVKHAIAYQENVATVFRHTHVFEVFGMMLARDYDTLAKHFVDLRVLDPLEVPVFLNGKTFCSQDEKEQKLLASANAKVDAASKDAKHHALKVAIVKERLRVCCWGVRSSSTEPRKAM